MIWKNQKIVPGLSVATSGANRFCEKVVWNLHSSDDRAFNRQWKGPGLDTQRGGSVPFITEDFFNLK